MRQGEAIQGSAHFKVRDFRRQQQLQNTSISVNWETFILRILNGLQRAKQLVHIQPGNTYSIPLLQQNHSVRKTNQPPLTQVTKQVPQTLSHHTRSLTQNPLPPGSHVLTTEQQLWAHRHPCQVTAAHLAQENPVEPWTPWDPAQL